MKTQSVICGYHGLKAVICVLLFSTATYATEDMTWARKQCEELGFKPKTEGYGKCVLQLSKPENMKPSAAQQQVQPPVQTYTQPPQTQTYSSSIQLPPCPGAHSAQTWTNCTGTYRVSGKNGFKYVGEFRDGLFHGVGIEYDSNDKVRKSGTWEMGSFLR